MNLDWYIARRYLASRKRGRLLSLITWIALGGVTVGVTALIVVIGVMTGMQQDLREKILGSTPHVLVLEHFDNPPAQHVVMVHVFSHAVQDSCVMSK